MAFARFELHASLWDLRFCICGLSRKCGLGFALASPYRLPGNAPWPTEHQKALRYAETQSQPYAMNYADAAAQRLGVKEGKWEAFTPRSSNMPSVKGGLDSGRPMLILQWRPGQ